MFHRTQSVWRQVQELGLKPAYSKRDSVYSYIRQLLALPFLPPNHVQPTFRNLEQRANSEPLRRLVTYIDRQWMTHAIVDIQSWSIFGCMVRTNNDVEGTYNFSIWLSPPPLSLSLSHKQTPLKSAKQVSQNFKYFKE